MVYMNFSTTSSTQGSLAIVRSGSGTSSRIFFQDSTNAIMEYLTSDTFSLPTAPSSSTAVPAGDVGGVTPITAVASSDGSVTYVFYVAGGILSDYTHRNGAWLPGTLSTMAYSVASGTPLYAMFQGTNNSMQLAVCYVANGTNNTLNVAFLSNGTWDTAVLSEST